MKDTHVEGFNFHGFRAISFCFPLIKHVLGSNPSPLSDANCTWPVLSLSWYIFQAQFDMPLLTPKKEEEDLLEKQQEDSLLARMKMFVQLRQDLERVLK